MLPYCVINLVPRHRYLSRLTLVLQQSKHHCTSAPDDNLGPLRALVQFCVDRYYLCPGQTNIELIQHGLSCSYGPLGMELRRNLLDQWWHSVSTSSAQVFGIKTLNCSKEPAIHGTGQLGIVDLDNATEILMQKDLSREELVQQLQELLQSSPLTRTRLYRGKVLQHLQGTRALRLGFDLVKGNRRFLALTSGCSERLAQQHGLFPGALEQFVPSLELMNRKLPFGLAETGLCLQPPGRSGW